LPVKKPYRLKSGRATKRTRQPDIKEKTVANRKQLKGVKNGRHKLSAGRRSRNKKKKSVRERKRLKLLARRKQVALRPSLSDITILE